jgi:hypothetical protein
MEHQAKAGAIQPWPAAPIVPLLTAPILARPALEYGCVDWFDYPVVSDSASEHFEVEHSHSPI